jgi:hypothetical protein
MKAEHRKELETNVLADYLGNAIQKAKEGPSQKVLMYGGLILLVIVLVGVFIWFFVNSKDKDAELWVQWNEMTQTTKSDGSKEELNKLRDQYPGMADAWIEKMYERNKFEADHPNTPQARMARFQKARLLLEDTQAMGSKLNFHRDTTLKCIAEGRDLYQKLIDESSDEPKLAEEAIFNAAKANEILGDYDQAKKLYERLKKDHPKSMDVPEADKALARLENAKDLEQLKKLAEK